MRHHVYDRFSRGVELEYQLDGKLFNLSCLKAKLKVTKTAVNDLRYTANCDIIAHSVE